MVLCWFQPSRTCLSFIRTCGSQGRGVGEAASASLHRGGSVSVNSCAYESTRKLTADGAV